MPLTGGLSGGGKSVILAFELWKEDINAKGGLLGRPVELVYFDDQTNPAQVPAIYSKLLDVDKVDLVVSSYGTNQIAPAMPIVIQRNLVFMALFGTGVNDNFNYDKYFQILPNGRETRLAPSLGFLETAMTMEPKPQTIALAAADAEYAQTVIAGARETIKRLGLKVVYDSTYPPTTVDFTPVVRAIKATNPDIVAVYSYPPDSSGMVLAAHEVGLTPKIFGGGMVGLQFAAFLTKLGPKLNGIVNYDFWVPEPTLKFLGIDEFLKKYQARAEKEGVDPLGYYLPPWAYAYLQILGQAVEATKSVDQQKVADYIRSNELDTIIGKVKFAPNGEWATSRVLQVQFQGIEGSDIEQFKKPGKRPVLYPDKYKSGNIIYPYAKAK